MEARIRSLEALRRTKKTATKLTDAKARLNAYWETRERRQAIAGKIKRITLKMNTNAF